MFQKDHLINPEVLPDSLYAREHSHPAPIPVLVFLLKIVITTPHSPVLSLYCFNYFILSLPFATLFYYV